MQQLIASYLFQHKSCPLPGVGTFTIVGTTSQADFTNKTISAPHPAIEFINVETNPAGLFDYVANKFKFSVYDAKELVLAFCNEVKNKIETGAIASLDQVGDLTVSQTGKILFKQEELPAAFWQAVIAERVIHPQAEHQILVGDKETTNTAMTEFLAEKPTEKNNWWIGAIALAVLGILLLLIYLSGTGNSSAFGNSIKI